MWDEADLIADGFERVHIELDWYDGPRAGIADLNGEPHYFDSDDCTLGGALEEYRVWPASTDAVALELEQWAIYVGWNQRYLAGEVGVDTHPGHGGVDKRYDELTALLAPYRQIPANARKLRAEVRFDQSDHYRIGGTNVWFRWHPGTDLDSGA
ncbi:hypothetical protein [Nocardia sp. NPDC052316]|uniref:hypothetical protein n=1 Tax=Nocardia sp. NPDC052316 TaxID=3364329 RepID=UPI0037CBB994